MNTESVAIEVGTELARASGLETTSGVLHAPARKPGGTAILLAHGAGKGMESEFLITIAEGLARAGHAVLRFNYLYTERMAQGSNRRPPDRQPVLRSVHTLAFEHLRRRYPRRALILAGKSMGGRIGSYLAQAGVAAQGLVFFGYPLHAPGKPDKPRSDHFPEVRLPALFLTGTRDALCQLDRLEAALPTFGAPTELSLIEGANHDFKVPKALKRSRDEVLADLVARTDDWLRQTI